MQFAIRNLRIFARLVAFPNEGNLVFALRAEVPVEAIVGDVELTIAEPRMPNDAAIDVPCVLAADRRLPEPRNHRLCLFEPEAVDVVDRAVIHFLVLFHRANVRLGLKLRGRRKRTRFRHERVDPFFLLCHAYRFSFPRCRDIRNTCVPGGRKPSGQNGNRFRYFLDSFLNVKQKDGEDGIGGYSIASCQRAMPLNVLPFRKDFLQVDGAGSPERGRGL